MGLNIKLYPYHFNKASVDKGTCSILKYYYRHVYREYYTKLLKYKIVVVADSDNKLVHLFRVGNDTLVYIGSHAVSKDRREEDCKTWFNSPTAFGSMSIPVGLFEEDDLEPFKCWTIDIPNEGDINGYMTVKWDDILPEGMSHIQCDATELFVAITNECETKYGYSIPRWLYDFARYLCNCM